MTTRLVLVGMVAALGISVPTWPEVQGWMNAAHAWTVHRLADWDSSEQGVAARIAESPSMEDVVAFEPIVVDDRPSGPADELNRAAEGQDIVPGPAMVRREPSVGRNEPTAAGVLADEFPDVAAFDALPARWMAELWLAAERSQSGSPPAAAEVAGRRARSIAARADCVFPPGRPSPSPDRQATAPSVNSGSLSASAESKPELIEPLAHAGSDIAEELNRFAEGIDVVQTVAAQSAGREPRFTPIDPDSTLDSGLAYELNRASDGLATTGAIAAPGPPGREGPTRQGPTLASTVAIGSSTSPEPSPDVAHAIRLTGQAVHAWMRIMTGPAIVQLSVR